MEAVEYLIYTLVFLVLIAFVGVIGYIIYDNYTYKNDLTTDLNTNFKGINKNFVSTTNVIEKVHMKHSSNLNVLGESLIDTRSQLDKKIDNVYSTYQSSSNVFDNKITDIYAKNTANSNLFTNNIDNFGYNMNRFFEFNNAANTPYDNNKKLFEYRTTPTDATARLNLITQTTVAAGLKVNTDATNATDTNSLQICNKTGTNCFQVLSTDNSLSIYKPVGELNMKNIYIGGNTASSPLAVINGMTHINGVPVEVRADGKFYVNNVPYVPGAPGTDSQAQVQPPVTPVAPEVTPVLTGIVKAVTVKTATGANYLTAPVVGFVGGGGTGATAEAVLGTTGTTNAGKVVSINVTEGGTGYTSAPSVTFTGGTATQGTTITAASVADVEVSTTNKISAININTGRNGSGYKKAPNVVINSGAIPSGGSLATATASLGTGDSAEKVTAIAVTNGGSGYTSIPTITFTVVP